MANTYAANFGDVIKHGALCEVLRRSRPSRYLESHGGRLDYDLGQLDPGAGGIWDFLALGAGTGLLDTTYGTAVAGRVGTPDSPGTYPGSIAFADMLLAAGAEIVAFELLEASATHLREGLAARGRTAAVHTGDGLSGVCRVARRGDLVMLDPFDVHAPGEAGTAVDAFVTLADAEIAVILWYAIYEPTDLGTWIADMPIGSATWSLRLIGDTSIGGLAGCGLLGANLTDDAEQAATTTVTTIVRTLTPVRPGLHLA